MEDYLKHEIREIHKSLPDANRYDGDYIQRHVEICDMSNVHIYGAPQPKFLRLALAGFKKKYNLLTMSYVWEFDSIKY